jgi:FdhE protein
MQRILDPERIEAFTPRSIPRLRLADPAELFRRRARRLRQLSETSTIAPYLALMAAVCEAQQGALATLTELSATPAAAPTAAAAAERTAQARAHAMPVLAACGWPRDPHWLRALKELCGAVAALPGFPDSVYAVCRRLIAEQPARLESEADRILAARMDGVDLEAAPFVMAALQVYWLHLTRSLATDQATDDALHPTTSIKSDTPGVCPVCGTLPVASIVRADGQFQGYRYLHCALCATEWHLVRITCSHCLATKGIGYQFIEGSTQAVRAETCDSCRMYRKILYQEKDTGVEPVADDLASLALDLLLTGEGYRRAGGNPLLWQPSAG